MATYYVDPAAAGSNNGSSWGNAWVDFQSAIQAPVAAGDTVYCRGTQTKAGGSWIALSGLSGTNAARVKFIGCSADGTPYAGQFTLQGTIGDLPTRLLYINGHDYLSFYNFTLINATVDCCILENGSNWNNFYNCSFSGAANGINSNASNTGTYMYKCIAKNNTAVGYNLNTSSSVANLVACVAYANGSYGFNITGGASFDNCCAWENADDNFRVSNAVFMKNCVSHGSVGGAGLQIADAVTLGFVIFSRFTNNNQYGIEVVTEKDTGVVFDYNGFFGNSVGEILNADHGVNDVTLTSDGYVDSTNDNYSLSGTAEQRRIEINMDW